MNNQGQRQGQGQGQGQGQTSLLSSSDPNLHRLDRASYPPTPINPTGGQEVPCCTDPCKGLGGASETQP